MGILLASGCSSMPEAPAKPRNQMGNLLLVEPAPASIRSQLALARLNQVLTQVQQMPAEQRAELLYQRGMLYDSVGLKGLAQFDFTNAVKYKPDLADAYNFIGIHHTQQQEFIQAYEAFDSILDIEPEHDYAFLNRGIALYYGGRPDLAVEDFAAFYEKDRSDPYRVLWSYIAQRDVNEALALEAMRLARSSLKNSWAVHIVDFYLGEISETQLLNALAVGVASQQQLTDRLCEAYFYLGKYHSAKGNQGVASNYFKLALSTNVYQFVEHRYARLELRLLREGAVSQTSYP